MKSVRAAHDASRAADYLLALERDRSIAGEMSPSPTPVLHSAHSEARPAGLSIARRRIENATGETGKRVCTICGFRRKGT